MTKIALYSDLHLECGYQDLSYLGRTDVDLIILAGDIVSYRTSHLLKDIAEIVKVPVVFVRGNHEYYGAPSFTRGVGEYFGTLQELGWNTRAVFDIPNTDIRVIGNTQWSTMRGNKKEDDLQMLTGISDFHRIGEWTPEKMVQQGEFDLTVLIGELEEARDDGKRVVVASHFAPTPECRNPRFADDLLTHYFNNDYTKIIEEYSDVIEAWCFGHTHYNGVYPSVAGVPIYINAKGYPNEMQDGTPFDRQFVIEV